MGEQRIAHLVQYHRRATVAEIAAKVNAGYGRTASEHAVHLACYVWLAYYVWDCIVGRAVSVPMHASVLDDWCMLHIQCNTCISI